jgi:CheY-like chemotaxis protein
MTPLAPPRILVVEDNLALSNVLRFNLQRAGYEVVVAANGVEALEQLAGQRFDLVISDQRMPEMSGVELCQALRREHHERRLPVMLVTAKGLELDFPRLQRELGVVAMFSKPFSPSKIVRAVGEILTAAASR